MRGDRFDSLVRAVARRGEPTALLVRPAAGAGRLPPPRRGLGAPASHPAGDETATCPPPRPSSPVAFCPASSAPGAIDPRWLTIVAGRDPAAGCLPGAATCDRDAACCTGVCTMHGRCACFAAGHPCPDDGFCCGGVCVDHRCR